MGGDRVYVKAILPAHFCCKSKTSFKTKICYLKKKILVSQFIQKQGADWIRPPGHRLLIPDLTHSISNFVLKNLCILDLSICKM